MFAVLASACALSLVARSATAPAAAAKNDPTGFRLESTSLTLNEDAGVA